MKQSPASIAKRSESLRRAHAEGRMGDYSHLKGLSGAQTSQWKGADITYRTVHSRLVSARGKAADHTCIDCGQQANEWSYCEPTGFSANLEDYSPRCHACHQKHDRRERDPISGRYLPA